MSHLYLRVVKLLREMRLKALDALEALSDQNVEKAQTVQAYLKRDYFALQEILPDNSELLGSLGRHIHFGELHDYKDILKIDIPAIEITIEQNAQFSDAPSPNAVQEIIYEYDVFVSYSSKDQKLAFSIYEAIKKAGGQVFLSEKNLKPGDDFAEEIRKPLVTSRELWLLVSPHSLKSEWVLTEWGAAWALKTKIVPILHQCSPENLPERLRKIQYIDAFEYSELVERSFPKSL